MGVKDKISFVVEFGYFRVVVYRSGRFSGEVGVGLGGSIRIFV